MISIIVATAQNRAIGRNNGLLWHLPEDLKRFRDITTGKKIIMGRKTFESLPRVLPNRKHIVISKTGNVNVNFDVTENVEFESDPNVVLQKYKMDCDEVFVIGGGTIYDLSIPYAEKFYLTIVKKDFFDADVFFPKLNYDKLKLIEKSEIKTDIESGLDYEYYTFVRQV